jgi:hypothetical protein
MHIMFELADSQFSPSGKEFQKIINIAKKKGSRILMFEALKPGTFFV